MFVLELTPEIEEAPISGASALRSFVVKTIVKQALNRVNNVVLHEYVRNPRLVTNAKSNNDEGPNAS